MPSAVDHLFVLKKKHPSDGKVIPQMDQRIGTRTLSHQLARELKDIRNPVLDSVLLQKRHEFKEARKEIFH